MGLSLQIAPLPSGVQEGLPLSEAWRVPRRQGGKEARMNREETVFGDSGGVGTSW